MIMGSPKLALHFKLRDENRKEILSRTTNIPISNNQIQQTFFYNWSLDSLKLNPGEQLEYHLEVWDNDGVNGRKSTKTANYTFLIPTEGNLVAEIKQSQAKTQQKIDQSVGKANKLQDQIEQANQKLKGKQTLDWQDKKMLEDIIQQKQGLDQIVEQLKEQNKLLEEKKEAFTEQDERIRQKAEQIQKLMEELLDEETKKLFEELQKLLKENTDMSQLQKLLDKLNQNTNNLEKELERTLELFKQLQYESKVDQINQDLKEQVERQESLLEDTKSLEKKNDGEKKEGNKAESKKDDAARIPTARNSPKSKSPY
jgi:chromosome segregation ATPase